MISPIDGKSMESITSVKIFHGSEFKANGKVIRWTEVRVRVGVALRHVSVDGSVTGLIPGPVCLFPPQVFFLQSEDQPNGLSDPADHSRLTENVARAFCVALCPHLKLLKEDGMAKLGLRVTLDSDQVRARTRGAVTHVSVCLPSVCLTRVLPSGGLPGRE